MTKVIDHIADLTGFRDRDVLDATLVSAINDLIHPQKVTIFRKVGEQGQERWLTRARQHANASFPSLDHAWEEIESLPLLAQYPHRLQCLQTQSIVQVNPSSSTTLFALMSETDAVGVLEVESERPLKAEFLSLVTGILRIYRNFESLLDYSERDSLTGLLNRKTFDESFLKAATQKVALSDDLPGNRRSTTQSLMKSFIGVIDIDFFKRVNDLHGHLIGDEVLLLVSRLMRSCFRFQDRLYRFGGEEFVVLLRCANEVDAYAAFDRFRAKVQSYDFPRVRELTLSVGFTAIRLGDTPNGAFERADKSVYFAKQHGRNQVCNYADLIRSGALQDESNVGDVELF